MKTVASKRKLIIPMLAFAGIALAGNPAIKLSDNAGNIITVDQNGAVAFSGIGSCVAGTTCSTVSSAGASAGSGVTWTGRIGDFTLTAIGQSQAQLGAPAIDISLQNLQAGNVGGTLTALWTDTDFSVTAPYLYNGQAAFNGPVGSFTQTAYADVSNVQFGTATQVTVVGPYDAFGNFFTSGLGGPSGDAISLTEKVVVVMPAGSNFFNDFGFAGSSAPLSLACPSSSGVAGTAYSSKVAPGGGLTPYTLSILSGSMPNGLAFNPSTGAIAGVPSAQGSYGFTAQVVDTSGDPVAGVMTANCGITISAPVIPLSLTCPAGTGMVGSAYSSALVAGGGTGHYTFSIQSGALPGGLTLSNTTGAIAGTLGTAGTFNFIGQVTDTGNTTAASVTQACTATISDPTGSIGDRIWTDTNSNGIQDISEPGISGMAITISTGGVIVGNTTSGTNGAYSFTSLAAGTYTVCTSPSISLTETYDFDGLTSRNCATVTLAAGQVQGGIDFGYVATGSGGGGTGQGSLTVACATSSAMVGTAYTSAITVTGGTAPYTYAVSAGSLPAGLYLNSTTGAITGTPRSLVNSTFTIKVTDKTGTTSTSSCGIAVTAALTAACPNSSATVGTAYTSVVKATGGVGPYTYSVAWGALPTGLTLNTATGAITGKPGKAEHAAFRIKITDSKGNVAFTSCGGSCTNGTTVSHEMDDSNGKLPESIDHNLSGYRLHTFGFDNNGKPAKLYGHKEAHQEIGIGIAGAVNNEIDSTHFVQVDISEVVKAGATQLHFALNSVSRGESVDIYGSNTLGSVGTLIKGQCSDSSTYFSVPNFKNYKYISFKARNSHVLLGSVSADFPCTCGIDVKAAGSGSTCSGGGYHGEDNYGRGVDEDDNDNWSDGSHCNDTGDHGNYGKCRDYHNEDKSTGAWGDGKSTCYRDNKRKH